MQNNSSRHIEDLNAPFLSGSIYKFLFFLLGLVYVLGLFVPLMDNDSAHHADIALHMYLTGDYVNLVDSGKDYLDKPHLLFWLSAFSYKVFGVTSFAYRFPSFLFTIFGTWSTYRLGKTLYDANVGKLAALLLAAAFAYILANNDVRMDAILTASIVFATWQLVEFIQQKKIINIAGAALGLALGFSTKGHIAVFTPAIGAFAYILYKKDWKIFLNPKWVLLLILFAVFISPVLYCYYLQYNLHPEKIVRGRDHINGVRFILLSQSIERFQGDQFGSSGKNDYFFFLHSFLWAFAPWSLLAFIVFIKRLKGFFKRKEEWLTVTVFAVLFVLVSLSGFKLPHYLNILFPTTAILVASFLISKRGDPKWIRALFSIQVVVIVLLLLLAVVINAWAFPVSSAWVIVVLVFLLALVFYFIKSQSYNFLQRAVIAPVAVMILFFFLLNSNFYPQLLKYQGGNELAFATKGKVDPAHVYFWKDQYSSSYNFYTATLRKPFADSVLQNNKPVWLLFDIKDLEEVKNAGYQLGQSYATPDFEITRLDIKFVNPAKRDSRCTSMLLVEVLGKK